MNDNNFGVTNHDERTVEFLKRDFAVLMKGIEGKKLDEINLDAVIEYLEILKSEVSNVKDGIRSRDNFVSYTMNPDDISSAFAKANDAKKR